ncbi:MAG: transposase, partial [Chloroflexi bacterium]|nr:transposase [Chloroflexota bacterium]
MIDRKTVFEIHRLKNVEYSERQIARELRLGRDTVKKYLENPEGTVAPKKPKVSKLDTYCEMTDSLLEEYPFIQAPVVLQRLQENGFDGQITIVRDYLRKRREKVLKNRQAFIRFESAPGTQNKSRLHQRDQHQTGQTDATESQRSVSVHGSFEEKNIGCS